MSRIARRLVCACLLSWSVVVTAGDPPLDPPPEPEAPAPVVAAPVPEAPAPVVAAPVPVATTPGQPEIVKPAPPLPLEPAKAPGDPFQQVPLDRMTPAQRKTAVAPVVAKGDEILIRAAEFFRKKDYVQADLAFARATQAKLTLSADEKVAWGYCRLADLSTRAANETDPAKLQEIEVATEAARVLGGARLDAAARQLLERLAAKGATSVVAQTVAPAPAPAAKAAPAGWQGLETPNFRILWKSMTAEQTAEIAGVVEAARTAMLQRWTGSTASPAWKPKCEVRIHADIASLKAACPQGDEHGCSAIAGQSGNVVSRRIDLVAGTGDLLDSVIPREITFLIVSELFADEPLSRWAEVGMSALAESPAQVRRYLATARRLSAGKTLFPVTSLIEMTDFPDPARISEFYAQSVSLVEFLVRRKGAVAFASLLRETPRRGLQECLKRHYGFATVAELEAQWLRDLTGAK